MEDVVSSSCIFSVTFSFTAGVLLILLPCSSTGFLPQGSSLLLASTCSSVGSSTGYRWIFTPLAEMGHSASPWPSSGTCSRISALAAGAILFLPSSLTLVNEEFLSSIVPHLSSCSCCCELLSPSS